MGCQSEEVEIRVDDEGNISYSKAVVRVRQGETIQFSCPEGCRIGLSFSRKTPFDQVDLQSEGELTVRDDANPGVYHYAVAIVDPSNRVWLDAACPTVIVRRAI